VKKCPRLVGQPTQDARRFLLCFGPLFTRFALGVLAGDARLAVAVLDVLPGLRLRVGLLAGDVLLPLLARLVRLAIGLLDQLGLLPGPVLAVVGDLLEGPLPFQALLVPCGAALGGDVLVGLLAFLGDARFVFLAAGDDVPLGLGGGGA